METVLEHLPPSSHSSPNTRVHSEFQLNDANSTVLCLFRAICKVRRTRKLFFQVDLKITYSLSAFLTSEQTQLKEELQWSTRHQKKGETAIRNSYRTPKYHETVTSPIRYVWRPAHYPTVLGQSQKEITEGSRVHWGRKRTEETPKMQ